jgi:group II intron reverse transcriptase/maturase
MPMARHGEVREMRTAEHVLAIIRDRGRRGLPLEDVYRQLYNPDLFLAAYAKIARNAGALTPGATGETADGMSEAKIRGLIALLRAEKYRWTPVRRVYIEKRNSAKKRPLGIPTWSDKLLQEVIRLILEAYYEPQFDAHAHGFRPRRGCHTALREIQRTWRGTAWFIEGDITGCFDNIDHAVLLATIAEKVHDNRFLRLLRGLLEAGYLEEWRYHRTLSGTPQGGVASPILANIYLDRLDRYAAAALIPQHTRGDRRKPNPTYDRLQEQARYLGRTGRRAEAAARRKAARRLPSQQTDDPAYRRLRYIRYADDFLLGFAGPRMEAEAITDQLRTFLRDELELTLSTEKTAITHARTGRARFLGYDLRIIHADDQRTASRRTINGSVRLDVPSEVVRAKCSRYLAHGKPVHRPELCNDAAFTIVAQYQAEYRGVVGYYRMAHNLRTLGRLKWAMETSLTKTLASKLRTSVARVYRRYHATATTAAGTTTKVLRVVVERQGRRPLVATWGGIPLARDDNATLDDAPAAVWAGRNELVRRLQADRCELCGSVDRVQVHHIRHLRDLRRHGRPPAEWQRRMASRQRKTLVVCHACHRGIHAGRPGHPVTEHPGEPDDAKVSRPVRRGLWEKYRPEGRQLAGSLPYHWFTDLGDARETIAAWREDYNAIRPHSALGNLTPLAFAERLRQPEVLSA